MKKSLIRRTLTLSLVCTLALWICAMAGAFAAQDSPIYALAIDDLPTRSGPGTKYRETGTHRMLGQNIRIISLAYDHSGVCWVQCEIPYGNQMQRLYTGLKRFDTSTFDLSAVPAEYASTQQVKASATSKAMYGPGPGYAVYDKLTVERGLKVTIIATEGTYAQVEWTTSKQSYRAWVPLNSLPLP